MTKKKVGYLNFSVTNSGINYGRLKYLKFRLVLVWLATEPAEEAAATLRLAVW